MARSVCLTTQVASLGDLLTTATHIAPHEAVAIAQQLLSTAGEGTAETDATADAVELHDDGVAVCRTGAPAVDAVGRLLDAMLPFGRGHRVPGALRFTIARACNSADAPPFASRAELSAVLERFECGSREDVVRELLARTAPIGVGPAPAVVPRGERRRLANASDLRRELRDADQQVFELRQASTWVPAPGPSPAVAGGPSRARWVAIVLAAVLGSFAAGYGVTEWLPRVFITEIVCPTCP